MPSPIEKLQKFLKLEAERGYDNRAIVGGLDKILPAWEKEARAGNLGDELIETVSNALREYPQMEPEGRAERLKTLMETLQSAQGEVPMKPNGLKGAPPPVAEYVHPGPRPQMDPPEGTQPNFNRRTRGSSAARADSSDSAGLNAPLTVLPGIGPKHAETLSELGLNTLEDLLYYFPRRYDDYSQLKPINRLAFGEELTVIATVQSAFNRPFKGGQGQMTEAVVSDGTGFLRLTWFNQPWIANRLTPGTQLVLSGKVDQYLGRLSMTNPDWEPLEQEHLHTNRIVPVYPVTARVTQKWLRRIMYNTVSFWAPRVPDYLPAEIRQAAGVVDLPEALMQIHFPSSAQRLKAAQSRLAFDEIFLMQMGVLRQKRNWRAATARIFDISQEWLDQQTARLPFTLTGAQMNALEHVRADMASGHPMDRLLQGDVGSGKTVIAALAAAMVISQGAQAAIMAPTSILAEQHYRSMLRLLTNAEAPYGSAVPSTDDTLSTGDTLSLEDVLSTDDTPSMGETLSTTDAPATDSSPSTGNAPEYAPLTQGQIRLLVGDTSEAEKEEIRAGLRDGSIKLIIGTHALIEDPVEFQDLQMVVIDEQHRFGVAQRAALRAKGSSPHLLVMTATPIPRSLALTIYGDLDVTTLGEMPAGRQPIETHVMAPLERERAYHLIRNQVHQGRQAFIIYPLVELTETSKDENKAAVDEHERLQSAIFPELSLGLLHGRLKPDEKEAVMKRFRDGEHQILVSTSVVEVGVDVPNATVMLVENAERFGLAQLHQFRGRVGRGQEKSYCLLIPGSENAIENERLAVMAETNDGFVLAERDLQQRGPGDFLGTRQSGFAELKMANITDIRLIEKAREAAQALFAADPDLSRPELEPLVKTLNRFWTEGRGDVS